ncbi:MAG: HEPN domain-containing protein [Candidatus Aenigmarchaeota archaeon]|nr:HEPN domain-containing protein [Candidatus Aenigmarchaeota archaeon]
MRKIIFLSKLRRKNKIQIVEPNKEVKDAYLDRSDESMYSAKTLLKIGNLRDSVAMIYYSMYYTLLALLFETGIKCENHSAAIIILKEVFDIDNSKISESKKERVDKQYYVDFSVTKKEVEDLIKNAEGFNNELLNFIDKLNSDDINKYRKKFLKIT